jgi:hypothetical protein
MEEFEVLQDLPGLGRGRVQRARQRTTGNYFAIKRVSTRRCGVRALNAELAAASLEAYQRLRLMRHSNLLPLETCFLHEDPTGPYLCTVGPLASAGSLQDVQLAAGGSLSGESLCWVAYGLVNALCFLHARDPAPLVHMVSVDPYNSAGLCAAWPLQLLTLPSPCPLFSPHSLTGHQALQHSALCAQPPARGPELAPLLPRH